MIDFIQMLDWIMAFNATSNNILVFCWLSVLLVYATGLSGEHHRPVECHYQTLSHNVVSSTPHHELDFDVSDDRHFFA